MANGGDGNGNGGRNLINWEPPSMWSMLVALVPMIALAIRLFAIQADYTLKQAEQDKELSNLRIHLENTEKVTSAYRITDTARYEAGISQVRELQEIAATNVYRIAAFEAGLKAANDRMDRAVDAMMGLREGLSDLRSSISVLTEQLRQYDGPSKRLDSTPPGLRR